MRYPFFSLALAGAACLLLAGCSTPQAALDQANHTVKLMALMEEPLDEFRRSWSGIEQSRLETMAEQRRLTAALELSADRDGLAVVAAGDKQVQPLRQKLLANADAVLASQVKAAAERKAHAEKRDGLLQPLPSTAAPVTAAQAEVAKLGTELEPKVRAKELLAFAQDVGKGLQANKKSIEEAKAKAAASDKAVHAAIEGDIKSVQPPAAQAGTAAAGKGS